MLAVKLSRWALTALAAVLGSVGIFMLTATLCLWSNFCAHSNIEAAVAIICLGLASGIMFAVTEDQR